MLDPSKATPPIFAALANFVEVAAFPDVFWSPDVFTPGRSISPDPLKDTPPRVLAVVKVAALPVVFWFNVGTSAAAIVLKLGAPSPPDGAAKNCLAVWLGRLKEPPTVRFPDISAAAFTSRVVAVTSNIPEELSLILELAEPNCNSCVPSILTPVSDICVRVKGVVSLNFKEPVAFSESWPLDGLINTEVFFLKSVSLPPMKSNVLSLSDESTLTLAVAPSAPSAPAGPCGPVAPWSPVDPVLPVGPCAPVAPCGPAGPCGPVAPVDPSEPSLPAGPCAPVAPVSPWGPCAPCAPVAPWIPWAPWAPVAPVAPVAPSAPSFPAGPWAPVGPWAPTCPGAIVASPFEFIVTALDMPAYTNSFISDNLKFLVNVVLESVPINLSVPETVASSLKVDILGINFYLLELVP